MTYYTYVVIGFGAELCTHTQTRGPKMTSVVGLYWFLMVEKEGV